VKLRPAIQAVPLALAAIALLHGAFADGLASEGGVGLTDVSGQPGDCTAPSRQAACATLFDGRQLLFPGGPAAERSVAVAWNGSRPAAALGLYVDNFSSRNSRSQAGCTAPDPASRLDLTVTQDGRAIYEGTLSDFAQNHGSATTALRARGESGRFTIAVSLDSAADNSYMGCVSTADLVWIASQ